MEPGRDGGSPTLAALRGRLTSPTLWAPIVFIVTLGALWQGGFFHTALGLRTFTVPYPNALAAGWDQAAPEIGVAAAKTLPAAFIGYGSGVTLGLLAATILVQRAPGLIPRVVPILAAANSMPIVALAPLIFLWVGSGLPMKVAIVTIMIVPTMTVYTVRGLTNADPMALELMASYEATRGQVYRHVRLPTAVPFIFTGLKSSVVLALVGTIVSEAVKGFEGLGFLIYDSLIAFRAATAWWALITIAALGIGWYLVVEILERLVVPWESASRNRE